MGVKAIVITSSETNIVFSDKLKHFSFSPQSILIFMALKNSKTGSLPVSEIYNFMTEHFPYFKVSSVPRQNTCTQRST